MTKAVWIKWLDATGDIGSEWLDMHDLDRFSLATVETLGWLLEETDTTYAVCLMIDKTNEKWTSGCTIPKSQVLEIRSVHIEGVNGEDTDRGSGNAGSDSANRPGKKGTAK